jgi:hypothetical protein
MVASTSRRGIEAGSLRDAEPVGEPSTSAGVARELAQDATAEKLAAALINFAFSRTQYCPRTRS